MHITITTSPMTKSTMCRAEQQATFSRVYFTCNCSDKW